MPISDTNQAILEELALHGLLESLTKAQAELRYVERFNLNSENDQTSFNDSDAIDFLLKEFKIDNDEQLNAWKSIRKITNNEESFKRYANYMFKRQAIIKQVLKGNGESLYLRYKDRLDRVLYSLIRVKSEDLAYDLFYSIDSSEITFGSAAEKHSCGPESKTRGIIGPVDLTTPHPEVSARLRTAIPGKIFTPFKADDWYAIIRLEYRFDSEYDEKTKAFLGSLIVGGKSKELSDELLKLHLELEV